MLAYCRQKTRVLNLEHTYTVELQFKSGVQFQSKCWSTPETTGILSDAERVSYRTSPRAGFRRC